MDIIRYLFNFLISVWNIIINNGLTVILKSNEVRKIMNILRKLDKCIQYSKIFVIKCAYNEGD
jgi:hypothetical protein